MKQFMVISRFSPVSLKINEMSMMLDPADLARWSRGAALIQNAMPYLTPAEREFLISGVLPSEWDTLWSDALEDELDKPRD